MHSPVHLRIEEPCHENWQQMTPNEQGRHCGSCQKTVIDFTLMSDQEILDYISRATSSVCGRFTDDQLNKTYAEKKIKPAFTFRYAWNVLVTAFLLAGSAATAQSKKTTHKKEQMPQQREPVAPEDKVILGGVQREIRITGKVLDDSTGLPVSFASVRIKGVEAAISANDTGYFEIRPPAGKQKVTIVVSAVGYEENEFEVGVYDFRKYHVMLARQADELKPVEVVAYGKITCRHSLGSVVSVIRETEIGKMKREINNWLPKKDVRIYPNPVMPGNAVNIKLNLTKSGDYKMELMDAAGRVVHVQALQIVQQEQVVNIPTQSTWSRGVYWLRISAVNDKKIYQAKLLLQ